MVKVLSLTRGRVRFHFPGLRGFHFEGSSLEELPGIKRVKFNRRRGSLLVEFDESKLPVEDLLKFVSNISAGSFSKFKRKEASGGVINRKQDSVKVSELVLRGLGLMFSPFLPVMPRIILTVGGTIPIIASGVRRALKGDLGLDFLNSLAVSSALLLGKFRTASAIVFLLRLGDYLEERALREVETFGDEFECLFMDFAWVIRDNKEVKVPVSMLKPGDLVVVRAGSRIPVDGVVVRGEGVVNQSFLTGEHEGVFKREGHAVYAMSAVEEGSLTVRAERVGQDTRAYQIRRLAEFAQRNRAEAQLTLESLSRKLVKIVLATSVLVGTLSRDISRGLAVLLVDYSCALKLISALSFMVASIRAKREGLLIRTYRGFENLAKVRTFLLDKTGTLTQMRPKLVKVVSLADVDERNLLRLVACVEEHFPHPYARAIVEEAERLGLEHEEDHTEPIFITAHGIVSHYNDLRIAVGSRHFLEDHLLIRMDSFDAEERNFSEEGYSPLFVSLDDKLAGVLLLSAPLKEEAKLFVEGLYRRGIRRVVLLTGDAESFARKVAQELGIRNWFSELQPEQKLEIVRQFQLSEAVAMVGDGINDAPALAQADVGIAMRGGADLAKVCADIIVEKDDLSAILFGIDLSRETLRRLRNGFFLTVCANSLYMLGGFTGILGPVASAILHNLTTILISFYFLNLKKWRRDDSEFTSRKS